MPITYSSISLVSHWSDPDNHRVFFDSIAAQSNFDPLLPHNWYSMSSYTISAKVYFSLLPSPFSLLPSPFSLLPCLSFIAMCSHFIREEMYCSITTKGVWRMHFEAFTPTLAWIYLSSRDWMKILNGIAHCFSLYQLVNPPLLGTLFTAQANGITYDHEFISTRARHFQNRIRDLKKVSYVIVWPHQTRITH